MCNRVACPIFFSAGRAAFHYPQQRAMYKLRPYQKQAVDAAVNYFTGGNRRNGLIVLPYALTARCSFSSLRRRY